MAQTFHNIDRYVVRHLSTDGAEGRTASVACYEGSSYRARLHFYRDGVTAPPSQIRADRMITLNFNAAQLTEVMETMRREKPLVVFFDDATHSGHVGTHDVEPIGEEEV